MNKNATEEKISESECADTVVIDAKVVDDTIFDICKMLSAIQDEKLIFDFFKCLFTPAELKDFTTRWLLVKEIDKGTTQREIARKFGMSLCKITRGSKELNKPDSAFKKILSYKK